MTSFLTGLTTRRGLILMWAAPSADSTADSMILVLALALALALEILMTHHVVSVRMFREVYDEFIGHCIVVRHLWYLLVFNCAISGRRYPFELPCGLHLFVKENIVCLVRSPTEHEYLFVVWCLYEVIAELQLRRVRKLKKMLHSCALLLWIIETFHATYNPHYNHMSICELLNPSYNPHHTYLLHSKKLGRRVPAEKHCDHGDTFKEKLDIRRTSTTSVQWLHHPRVLVSKIQVTYPAWLFSGGGCANYLDK